MAEQLVIFVHGYSVSSSDTYGELPARMRNEAEARGFQLRTEDIYLARYVSFNDEVRLSDLSAALEAALRREIFPLYPGKKFVCITHSTGGPLVRNWVNLFYRNANCPMQHLVMLAPANHGSALAQLGKSRLGRLKSWFSGMEPGRKVLDWLELGNPHSWQLNRSHIDQGDELAENGIFYFVLTGQDIDRKLYDHINSYTGEPGSDGVVRVASASLNNRYLLLEQSTPDPEAHYSPLKIKDFKMAAPSPLRVLSGKSHSNSDMGIMRSVRADSADTRSADTIQAIFECMAVTNQNQYRQIITRFATETEKVQLASRLETEIKPIGKKYYIHDRYAMVVFRIRDSEGHPVTDYDLLLTAGPESDPDDLPPGFFCDRQCNRLDGSTLTYYFNYDIMNGCVAVYDDKGSEIRPLQPGIRSLGISVIARPEKGLVRYVSAVLPASEENFMKMLQPNSATLVEIVLRRLVSTEVLQLEKMNKATENWKNTDSGSHFIS